MSPFVWDLISRELVRGFTGQATDFNFSRFQISTLIISEIGSIELAFPRMSVPNLVLGCQSICECSINDHGCLSFIDRMRGWTALAGRRWRVWLNRAYSSGSWSFGIGAAKDFFLFIDHAQQSIVSKIVSARRGVGSADQKKNSLEIRLVSPFSLKENILHYMGTTLIRDGDIWHHNGGYDPLTLWWIYQHEDNSLLKCRSP